MKDMGMFLASLRREQGMTQKDLAERLGVTDKSVSRWERGETAPDLTALPLLAACFGVTVDELVAGKRLNEKQTSSLRSRTELHAHRASIVNKRILNFKKIKDDADRISAVYDLMNEETRLTHSKASRVEMRTTVSYIEAKLKPGMRILELGAGTGEYSLYFAQKGYSVTAVDIAESNIAKLKEKLTEELDIQLSRGDARDLRNLEDNAFDIVLVLGPLYPMESRDDALRCVREALRVMKPDGYVYFAYISSDMVILTEWDYRPLFFKEHTYNHETFAVLGFPFYFHTVDEAVALFKEGGVEIVHAVASDGISELMAEKINALDDEDYAQYLRFHFYCREKREHLGRSNHLLYVGQKPKKQE